LPHSTNSMPWKGARHERTDRKRSNNMMRRRGGVVRGVARTAAVAGTASAVSGRVHRRQQNKWAEQDQQDLYEQQSEQQAAYNQGVADAARAPAPAPAPAAAGSDTDDLMEQLEKLGELRDKGILTDAEFQTQKAKLLG